MMPNDGDSAREARLSTREILDQIHELQDEIFEREVEIATLVDSAEHSPPLSGLREAGVERRKIRQLERLIADWNTLVARSRTLTEDDLDLIAALVRFIGDLLIIQPEGVDEHWIGKLEDYLDHSVEVD